MKLRQKKLNNWFALVKSRSKEGLIEKIDE